MKKNRGITLIALVITIIVMLILILVTVSYAIKRNGVIESSLRVRDEAEIAKEMELIEQARIEWKVIEEGKQIAEGTTFKSFMTESLNLKFSEGVEVTGVNDGPIRVTIKSSQNKYIVTKDRNRRR